MGSTPLEGGTLSQAPLVGLGLWSPLGSGRTLTEQMKARGSYSRSLCHSNGHTGTLSYNSGEI